MEKRSNKMRLFTWLAARNRQIEWWGNLSLSHRSQELRDQEEISNYWDWVSLVTGWTSNDLVKTQVASHASLSRQGRLTYAVWSRVQRKNSIAMPILRTSERDASESDESSPCPCVCVWWWFCNVYSKRWRIRSYKTVVNWEESNENEWINVSLDIACQDIGVSFDLAGNAHVDVSITDFNDHSTHDLWIDTCFYADFLALFTELFENSIEFTA